MTTATTFSLFDPQLVKPAVASAFAKLDPRVQWRNPVMFVVYVGSIITTILWVQALGGEVHDWITLHAAPFCFSSATVATNVPLMARVADAPLATATTVAPSLTEVKESLAQHAVARTRARRMVRKRMISS